MTFKFLMSWTKEGQLTNEKGMSRNNKYFKAGEGQFVMIINYYVELNNGVWYTINLI